MACNIRHPREIFNESAKEGRVSEPGTGFPQLSSGFMKLIHPDYPLPA